MIENSSLKLSGMEARGKGSKLMNHLAQNSFCITLAVSLGWVKTLIEHPSSMTHAAVPPEKQAEAGIDTGGIRISVGLENCDDIINDLEEGLSLI